MTEKHLSPFYSGMGLNATITRMTRLFLRLIPILLLLFAAIAGLIRAQPYDDNGLREILIPSCGAPCFLGIHPGLTSGDEAFKLLNAHPWITNIEFNHDALGNADVKGDGTISWSWNGTQPSVLRTPFLIAGEIAVHNGVVDSIKLRTAIPFSAVWFALGWPANGWIRPSRVYLGQYDNHIAIYPQYGLEFRTLVQHPLRTAGFWNAPVEIYFETNPPADYHYMRPCWWACPPA